MDNDPALGCISQCDFAFLQIQGYVSPVSLLFSKSWLTPLSYPFNPHKKNKKKPIKLILFALKGAGITMLR